MNFIFQLKSLGIKAQNEEVDRIKYKSKVKQKYWEMQKHFLQRTACESHLFVSNTLRWQLFLSHVRITKFSKHLHALLDLELF